MCLSVVFLQRKFLKACQKGDTETVRSLLTHEHMNINPKYRSLRNKETALVKAAKHNHSEIVKLCLNSGVGYDIQDSCKDGFNALHWACANSNAELAEHIIQRSFPELINAATQSGATPLFLACDAGSYPIADMLISKHPEVIDVNRKITSSGVTALFAACASRRADLVRLLVSHPKIDVNPTAFEGATPLMTAASSQCVEAVQLLLSHPTININDQTTKEAVQPNTTVMHIACEKGNVQIVEMLLKKANASWNRRNGYGQVPLHLADMNGYDGIVKMLLADKRIDASLRRRRYRMIPSISMDNCMDIRYNIFGTSIKLVSHPDFSFSIGGKDYDGHWWIDFTLRINDDEYWNILDSTDLGKMFDVVEAIIQAFNSALFGDISHEKLLEISNMTVKATLMHTMFSANAVKLKEHWKCKKHKLTMEELCVKLERHTSRA